MYQAYFLETCNSEWLELPFFALGKEQAGAEPDLWVGILQDGQPYLRVGIFLGEENKAFKELRCLEAILVIGAGHQVYFIDMRTKKAESIALGGYFADLYTPADFAVKPEDFDVLVASESGLFRLTKQGQILWQVKDLGIDGVIVHDVKNGVINGSGEWDPPGGWKEFRLWLGDGAVCS